MIAPAAIGALHAFGLVDSLYAIRAFDPLHPVDTIKPFNAIHSFNALLPAVTLHLERPVGSCPVVPFARVRFAATARTTPVRLLTQLFVCTLPGPVVVALAVP